MSEVPPKPYHQSIPHYPEDTSSLPLDDKDIAPFEKHITSLHNLMRAKQQLPSFDSVRRAAEEVDGRFTSGDFSQEIPEFLRQRLPEYGERRILAVETVLCELGYLTREELAQGLTALSHSEDLAPDDLSKHLSELTPANVDYNPEVGSKTSAETQYHIGDRVQVTADIKPGHIRTPVYLLGKFGTIVNIQGHFSNPEDLAHFRPTVACLPLYLVEFTLAEVWQDECPAQSAQDKIRAEIYEPWLSLVT